MVRSYFAQCKAYSQFLLSSNYNCYNICLGIGRIQIIVLELRKY